MGRRAVVRAALRAAVLVGLVVGAACGASEGADEPTAAGDAPSTSTTSAAPAADGSAFCELLAGTAGEVDESYLGSAEHRAQLDRLVAAAPDEVRPDVERFRDHVREFVDPAVPGSAAWSATPTRCRRPSAALPSTRRSMLTEPPAPATPADPWGVRGWAMPVREAPVVPAAPARLDFVTAAAIPLAGAAAAQAVEAVAS